MRPATAPPSLLSRKQTTRCPTSSFHSRACDRPSQENVISLSLVPPPGAELNFALKGKLKIAITAGITHFSTP